MFLLPFAEVVNSQWLMLNDIGHLEIVCKSMHRLMKGDANLKYCDNPMKPAILTWISKQGCCVDVSNLTVNDIKLLVSLVEVPLWKTRNLVIKFDQRLQCGFLHQILSICTNERITLINPLLDEGDDSFALVEELSILGAIDETTLNFLEDALCNRILKKLTWWGRAVVVEWNWALMCELQSINVILDFLDQTQLNFFIDGILNSCKSLSALIVAVLQTPSKAEEVDFQVTAANYSLTSLCIEFFSETKTAFFTHESLLNLMHLCPSISTLRLDQAMVGIEVFIDLWNCHSQWKFLMVGRNVWDPRYDGNHFQYRVTCSPATLYLGIPDAEPGAAMRLAKSSNDIFAQVLLKAGVSRSLVSLELSGGSFSREMLDCLVRLPNVRNFSMQDTVVYAVNSLRAFFGISGDLEVKPVNSRFVTAWEAMKRSTESNCGLKLTLTNRKLPSFKRMGLKVMTVSVSNSLEEKYLYVWNLVEACNDVYGVDLHAVHGVEFLTMLVVRYPEIRMVQLDGAAIPAATCLWDICTALLGKSLTSLYLVDCSGVLEKHVLTLINACPNLTALELSGRATISLACLTSAVYTAIGDKLGHLQELHLAAVPSEPALYYVLRNSRKLKVFRLTSMSAAGFLRYVSIIHSFGISDVQL